MFFTFINFDSINCVFALRDDLIRLSKEIALVLLMVGATLDMLTSDHSFAYDWLDLLTNFLL